MDKSGERSVVVTGGGRGIGAATSRLCAARGWAVAVNYAHDGAAAEAIVDELRAAGGRAVAVQADVASEAAVVELFARVDRELPPLYGLVNNAGVVDQALRVEAITAARLERMFAINVFGSFYCARESVRRMATDRGGSGGSIVNLSSAAARLGGAGNYVDYAASKGAIDSFTIGLAKEVAGLGIRVNAVRPGLIETEIHASGGQPGRARELAPQVPMLRTGSAEEVAEAIVWLLGPGASYCTASFIDVGGGR
ncbi:MAG: SDR family oxidoreductase [Pseudomonadota bacterium]|nr:SDR family oxidoreductase [Pseudomonadota bacterium]